MSINGGNIDEGSCLSGENDEGSAVYSETKRAASPVPSCVSMKSDHSMFEPPAFSDGGELPRLENQRITSPVPSCVSMKSDHSMFEPPAFRNEAKRPRFDTKQQRAASSELSCVSMKSSHSMFEPPAFINGPKHSVSENQQTAASVPSCVSVKSSHSMFEPPAFSDKAKRPRFDTKQKNTASSELSCVSMKSSHSMFEPPAFSSGPKNFTCGLCGQIFKDPASSSSGHSFCTQCISRYWEQSVPPKCRISEDFQDTIQRVRQKHPKNVSPERWINFLHCFIEMKDNSFQREVKSLLNAKRNLTGWDCTRIAYSLQMSEEVLDEFDPKKYKTSDEGRRRLIPVVRNCRKALLANFKLTKQHCEIVISALQSANSVLTELDLSYNDIQDSGVKQLCECLKNPYCKLETLRLVMCNLTKKTCEYVAPALQSANSGLKELDLSQNDLEDSGVRLLSGGLKSSHCQLETLRLSGCLVTEEGCASLASALSSNPSHLRELDLSYNHPGESGMKLLRAKVDDPNYKLDKLNFNYGGVFTMKPGVRKYASFKETTLRRITTLSYPFPKSPF
ncbi:hypothetical protein MHYP_G00168640 [Metynnis hypsauchen]